MNYKILRPSGILDGPSANELRHKVTNLIAEGEKIIVLDFENISFANSSAIGALVATLKTVISNQGELYICSIGDQVKLIFEITKMDQLFDIYETVDEIDLKLSAVV